MSSEEQVLECTVLEVMGYVSLDSWFPCVQKHVDMHRRDKCAGGATCSDTPSYYTPLMSRLELLNITACIQGPLKRQLGPGLDKDTMKPEDKAVLQRSLGTHQKDAEPTCRSPQ